MNGYTASTRPPPPSGPPPKYSAVVHKVYPYSLRPILIFTSILGFIWGLAMGVESIRDMSDDGETSKEKIFDLVMAILFFVVAGIEAFALLVAIVQNLKLGNLLRVLAPVGLLVAVANLLIGVVIHFTLKNDIITQCTNSYSDSVVYDGVDGVGRPLTTAEASSLCNSSWSRGTWSVFAWLIIGGILAFMFWGITMAYYRQLLDPSTIRQRGDQPQVYAMQAGPYAGNPPPPNPNGQQAWMVPPYPGPPAGAPPAGYEKSDYHPEAAWAQTTYAPPAGPPPGEGSSSGPHAAEEDAWERAQSGGVTAHLTGHGTGPRRDEESGMGGRGYVVGNEEEDEAWEEARRGGVTAHLTGQPGGRREGTV